MGPAAAELTAFQNLAPSADVGQMVTVTVSLTYNGQTPTEAVVTPSLPSGVVANAGVQSTQLYPGVTQQISYPLTAQQSGTYWIVSEISYAEEGRWRNLRLEAPFTATASAAPELQPVPGEQTPGAVPDGSNPMDTDDPSQMPQGGDNAGGEPPHETQPSGGKPDSGSPEAVPDKVPDQEEQPQVDQ